MKSLRVLQIKNIKKCTVPKFGNETAWFSSNNGPDFFTTIAYHACCHIQFRNRRIIWSFHQTYVRVSGKKSNIGNLKQKERK